MNLLKPTGAVFMSALHFSLAEFEMISSKTK